MTKIKNYINNKTLYECLINYKEQLREAEKNNVELPRVTAYIGESLFQICNKLSTKSNFGGYSLQWKQEMISDALMDCLAAVDNFKPERTNNPFAYFTQIAWNAFLRRIAKEKKQTYIKHKNYENMFLNNGLYDGDSSMQLVTNEYSDEIVKSFENKFTIIKKNDRIRGLELFANGAGGEDVKLTKEKTNE